MSATFKPMKKVSPTTDEVIASIKAANSSECQIIDVSGEDDCEIISVMGSADFTLVPTSAPKACTTNSGVTVTPRSLVRFAKENGIDYETD
jgi:hypothetical protein